MPPLRIGSHAIWPPLVLAPMSGVTNRTMRALYKPFGLGLTVTEFVSANALKHTNARTMEMIDQHGLEKPVSTQLWGDDPATMAAAAKVVRECGADIVDINFGCPAPKVTKTNGGSACLRDVDRCEAIMKAVVDAVDAPVTMKMRLGWTESDLVYVDVAKRAQRVGVRAVTLHARTARQFYKGSADWEHIKRLKDAIDIPVIGNGDLDDPHVAMERMRESGVDGIMLGRATLGNPWLIAQIA
ncbi:MAG TPA: tRNA dihydrouridine synthase DusB, partial [Candidatus Baltobacteraceae bacterium]|nr:tRNA dihydrouridine synthase DusB [Candidatus Baltobacteraceae bacterium]